MTEAEPLLSVLGTRWVEDPTVDVRWRGFLRLRMDVVDAQARRSLGWTVDGEPVRDWFTTDDVELNETTHIVEGATDGGLVDASLGAPLPDRAAAFDPDVHFDDGRVAILFCAACGDLECGALSVDLRWTETTVEWRNVTYQDTISGELWTPEMPVRSVRFEREAYEATIRDLLGQWGTRRK
ncbi:hypothetical protein [Agrococcus jenensis]|uniref:Uncharacterized protein n=1 Tax=Agrococcus jenensis TaxID=46353 RepID=A0A3N2APW0_9MICO|nr:hypothetical protein [Agrococcus jenensis]ROR65084.1 hypothetical protein EDD26_0443 [Agrococcus jenensis]